MLTTTVPLLLLDHHRAPYGVGERPRPRGFESLGSDAGLPRELLWPSRSVPVRPLVFRGIPFVGSLHADGAVREALDTRSWERVESVDTLDGKPAGYVLRADDGSVLLPFHPDDLVRSTLAEEYRRIGRADARSTAVRAYYAVRRLMPRPVQLTLRRAYARVQERAAFPDWPIEPRVADTVDWLFGVVREIAGEEIPSIAPWPDGKAWAVVLTHDVERAAGYEFVDRVVDAERARNLRSAWYFVPERDYVVSDQRVASLAANGFEVGVHGLHHDGRDMTPGTFEERAPRMTDYARHWNATGFRSPSTLRNRDLIVRLGMDYDSSFMDTARFEPVPGGCCSWFPFFIGDLVELPITMPMDHTLFDLLGHENDAAWTRKAAFLKRRGGMMLLLTHPDYLRTSGRLELYERLLDRVARDETAWHALPREVSAWWRARAASALVRRDGEWQVEGPAAGRASVRLGTAR